MFKHLHPWQKGFLFGLFFTFFLSFITFIALVAFEFIKRGSGLPHFCYVLSKTVECTFQQAIVSHFYLFMIMILLFGIPTALVGLLIGLLIEKS